MGNRGKTIKHAALNATAGDRWVGLLLGTCLLLGACGAGASQPSDGPSHLRGAVAGVAGVPSSGVLVGESVRSRRSSSSGYVYSRSPDGPALIEGRRNEAENDSGNEERRAKSTRENTKENSNDSPRRSDAEKAIGGEENSESSGGTVAKNEIEPNQEVPPFFTITSRVASSTSVGASGRSAKPENTRGAAKSRSETVKLESNTSQSSKKLKERSRTTSTKRLKKNGRESIGKQEENSQQASVSSAEQRRTAYDHFFNAARRSSSSSAKPTTHEGSEPEEKPGKTEAEEENDQESADEATGSSFFTIASHKTKSASSRQPGPGSKRDGKAKSSDRDAENEKKQDEKQEDNEDKSDGSGGSKGDDARDEGKEEEDEEEEEEEEEEGSEEEEESEEDESSEEDDGTPAFIVLRRPNANGDRNDRNRESAKHFRVGKVGYDFKKDISDEKLLFLPVIDGKDLSISTIRTLSSQLSRRGEPIHLEYKELKDGVEGYVAELDNSGSEYFINKLMDLIANLEESGETADHSVSIGDQVSENLKENVSKNSYKNGRSSQNIEIGSVNLPSHFQVPQNRFKSQTSVSRKETAQKAPTVHIRGKSPSVPTGSQQEKSFRESTSSFFRSQSSSRSSSTRTNIRTSPGPASASDKGTNGDSSTSDTGDLGDGSPRSKGILLPTTIPIEISPVRSSLKSIDEQPRIRIKAELVHSANPNSKARASIKISDEEIKAITNRYSQFLENYRRSRARGRTPDSQVLRENQARKQLSKLGGSSFIGKDSGGSNLPDSSNSGKTGVEIVTAVPVRITEETIPVPQLRQKTSEQSWESISITPTKQTSSHFVVGGGNLVRTFTASQLKTEIESGLSQEVIAAIPPLSSSVAAKESNTPSLVPLTEPDSVKANKIVLISGAESDSLEKDSSGGVAIPTTPIKLIPKEEVTLTQKPLLLSNGPPSSSYSTAFLKQETGNTRVDYMREIIRNRLLNILNARARKSAAAQSNVRFSLEDVDPSQLPIQVLSKMQASRLSNDGVRLADLSSSTHITDALSLGTDDRTEIERATPTLKIIGSNDFSTLEARKRDFNSTAGSKNAFVSNLGAGAEVISHFGKPSSDDNIVEESQRVETSRNAVFSDVLSINAPSDAKPIDPASLTRGSQLFTSSAHESGTTGTQSIINAPLSGDVGVPLPSNIETQSASFAGVQGGSVASEISDNAAPTIDDSGVSLDATILEAPDAVIEEGTLVSASHDTIFDDALVHSNTPQQEVAFPGIDQVDSTATNVVLDGETGHEQVDGSFTDAVIAEQFASPLPSSPSELEGSLQAEIGPLPSTVEVLTPLTTSPQNLFEEAPSVGDVNIPIEDASIPESRDDQLTQIDLSLFNLNQGSDGQAEPPNIEVLPATSDIRDSNFQEISDLSAGPTVDELEAANPTPLTGANGDVVQLQEIGAQIENLLSTSSSSVVSKSFGKTQEENQASDVFTAFNSAQNARGKSLSLATGQKPKDKLTTADAEAQASAALRETIQERFNARLMQMIQERALGITQDSVSSVTQEIIAADSSGSEIALGNEAADSASDATALVKQAADSGADVIALVKEEGDFSTDGTAQVEQAADSATGGNAQVKEVADSATKKIAAGKDAADSTTDEIVLLKEVADSVTDEIALVEEVANSAADGTAQAKEIDDQPPQVITSTDSILSTPIGTLEVSPDSSRDVLEKNAENESAAAAETPADLIAGKVTAKTTIDDEIQKRFQARLMQMIQERAKAMLKISDTSTVVEQKQVEVPPAESESTQSTIELSVTTAVPASKLALENTDLLQLVPGTSLGSQKELTIIESLDSSDSRKPDKTTAQPEDQQTTLRTDKAIEDQLQERLNARLTQIIQDRMKVFEANSFNTHDSETDSVNVAKQEISTQTSEIGTETALPNTPKVNIPTTEATIPQEKSVDVKSEAAIREFMLERLKAGLATVVHTGGEEQQLTTDAPIPEVTTPDLQNQEATVQKIDLAAAWSHNDRDRLTLTPQVPFQDNVNIGTPLQDNLNIDTSRNIEINDRMNTRLMEMLHKKMEDHISASLAKELESGTAVIISQNSNPELMGKSTGSENLQTIEQLIAGVEGTGAEIPSAIDGAVTQVIQESAAIVPVNDVIEPLKFDALPNVRILSPNGISALIENGGSTPTADVIPSAIVNEVQQSSLTPQATPESVPNAFSEVSFKPVKAVRLSHNPLSAQAPLNAGLAQPQLLIPRVEISSVPQVAPAITRLEPLPADPQRRGSRVLTQEQFIVHLRDIENKQRLASVRGSQNFVRQSPRPETLNVLQTLGVGADVVKATRQPGRIQNEVFIQPVVRPRQPQPLPTPRRPPFVPAFPNARSARLLSRLNEGDLRQSSRTQQRTRITPAVASSFPFFGSSLGNQFILFNDGKSGGARSLQKSLSNSEGPVVSSSSIRDEEVLKTEVPLFIVRPKNIDTPQTSPTAIPTHSPASPTTILHQLPSPSHASPSAPQAQADQTPVVTKARLQNMLTESDLFNPRNSNPLPSNAKSDRFVQNVTQPRTTTGKIPLMMAKSVPSEITNFNPSRTSAVEIPFMMAKSINSEAKLGRSRTSKRTRLTSKSSAATNFRIAKDGSSRLPAHPVPLIFDPQLLMPSTTLDSRSDHRQVFHADIKVKGQRKAELKSASHTKAVKQVQENRRSNSAISLANAPEVVTVRSRSGNLFNIPVSVLQEFLIRKNSDSQKSNIEQARTLLQTLFVDGERERLKRKAPRVGTVTRDELQQLMGYIQLHRTTPAKSVRNKRAADFTENSTGEEDFKDFTSKTLRNLKNTENSDEISSPKIVFDERGTYLTDGKGKNIFFQAVEVFYH